MVSLPPLVFRTQIEGARVLEVRRKNHGFITGLSGQLNAKVPRVESDEGELEAFGHEVFLGKGIEASDCVSEGAGVSDLIPGEGREARAESCDGCVHWLHKNTVTMELLTRFGIEEYPSELNDFSRILCNVDAVLITSCSYVYYDVSVKVRCLWAVGGHQGGGEGRSGSVVSKYCLWVIAVVYTLRSICGKERTLPRRRWEGEGGKSGASQWRASWQRRKLEEK